MDGDAILTEKERRMTRKSMLWEWLRGRFMFTSWIGWLMLSAGMTFFLSHNPALLPYRPLTGLIALVGGILFMPFVIRMCYGR